MKLSLDSEISRRIGKATGTMSKWTRRAWKTNFWLKTPKCTSTKHAFSASCSTAVKLGPPTSDRNAAWTLSTCYASAHLRHQVAIPHPQQWDTVTCWFPQHALPPQRRLRWLGPVHRMDDGHIPKKVLYRQLITGVGKVGCAALRFKDAWKHDLKACEIDPNNWEDLRLIVLAWDGQWKKERESKCETSPESWRKARSPQKTSTLSSFNLIFPMCGRDCHSRIGLHSHTRSCRTTIDWLGRTYLVSRDFTCQLATSSQGGGGGRVGQQPG